MDTNLLDVINAFAGMRVLVVGEAMLDSYLAGTTDRLCREAPVPVVEITDREHVPGGASNTAVNVHSLGAEVMFVSVVGDDPEGALLLESLRQAGISTRHIRMSPSRSTLAKQRVIAASQMVVRFDQGSTDPLEEENEAWLIQQLEELYPTADAVILSDYDYGIFTPGLIEALDRLQHKDPRILLVDSKRLPHFRQLRPTAVKPNFTEALRLLGFERHPYRPVEDRVNLISEHGSRFIQITRAQIAAVTMDQEGAIIFERDRTPYRTYAKAAPNSRAAGAGDTFISALGLSLAAGAQTESAAEIASAAASIVVSKNGTSACYADELRAHFSTDEKFVTDVFQLAARLAAYRHEDRRIVFTNGCFDILHRGHIAYLNRAKAQGDVLIIGLNSDESVRRLKGSTRPINSLEDRAQVLAALSCVDHIVAFDSDTPHDLIRVIEPDVFVKGGDYTRETLPEASLVEALGGEVRILPYLEDHSTSSIIERIRQIYSESTVET